MKSLKPHLLATILLVPAGTMAGPVGDLKQFQANTPAVAADVNANFAAVKQAANDNSTEIENLRAEIAELRAQLDSLQAFVDDQDRNNAINFATSLQRYTSVGFKDVNGTNQPTVTFSGVNVYIDNGRSDDTVNGRGNLVIGRNESTGTNNKKTGSHNLIIGPEHYYDGRFGIVSGKGNLIKGDATVALGGEGNAAEGFYSATLGGTRLVASSQYALAAGGENSKALGPRSAVIGSKDAAAYGRGSAVIMSQDATVQANFAGMIGKRDSTILNTCELQFVWSVPGQTFDDDDRDCQQ